MDKYYHITIDDGAPLPTEDDMKVFAEKIGITYDEYIEALDNGFYKTTDVLAYVKEKHNKKSERGVRMWNTFSKEAVEAWEKYCRLFEEKREKNSNIDLL